MSRVPFMLPVNHAGHRSSVYSHIKSMFGIDAKISFMSIQPYA